MHVEPDRPSQRQQLKKDCTQNFMAETQFSITKLMSIIPKFKEAFIMSSLLWNQGARSLPVSVAVQLSGQ